MIFAGALRETVTLQSPPGTDDGAGGQTGGWSDVARFCAGIEAMTGAESVNAGIDTGLTRYRVTIRRRRVSTAQRLLWTCPVLGPQILDIIGALPMPDRSGVVLTCVGRNAT